MRSGGVMYEREEGVTERRMNERTIVCRAIRLHDDRTLIIPVVVVVVVE
jgi:hypothetical protein